MGCNGLVGELTVLVGSKHTQRLLGRVLHDRRRLQETFFFLRRLSHARKTKMPLCLQNTILTNVKYIKKQQSTPGAHVCFIIHNFCEFVEIKVGSNIEHQKTKLYMYKRTAYPVGNRT